MLDNLASNLEEVKRQLDGWDDDAAMPAGAIQTIDANLDNAIERLRRWAPTLNVTSRARQVAEIAAASEARSDSWLASFDEKATELSTRFDADEARLTLLSNAIDAHLERVAAADSALAATTTQLLEDSKKELTDLLTESKVALDEELKAGRQAFADTTEDLGATVEETVKTIDAEAIRAKELVAIIGGQGVSDGYHKYAEAQQRSAFWWSLSAVVLGAIAIGFLGFVLWDIRDETDPNPALLALKGAVTVSGFTIAGYMTRIGAHHRAQAVKARFRSLDMHALGPYSENLSKEDKQTLMMDVGRYVFGNEDTEDEKATTTKVTR